MAGIVSITVFKSNTPSEIVPEAWASTIATFFPITGPFAKPFRIYLYVDGEVSQSVIIWRARQDSNCRDAGVSEAQASASPQAKSRAERGTSTETMPGGA